MITRRASNVLLFSTVLFLSACGRDRRHRSRHHLTTETEVTSSSPNGDGEEVTSATELWSEEEFELLTPAMPGFLYKNDSSSQSIKDCVCSVDIVEELTGFDFFYSLSDDIEDVVESDANLSKWN